MTTTQFKATIVKALRQEHRRITTINRMAKQHQLGIDWTSDHIVRGTDGPELAGLKLRFAFTHGR